MSLVGLLVLVAICGVIYYLVQIATFIAEPFKAFLKWALIAICAISLIVWLASLTGWRPPALLR